ncbi:hypothetical protein [Nocardiopsis synnemataformans]|uniref:hypothetical protein n=1 Tax=Nocardiopsis synnemataformans TaxID=61305 RepID=UPI003EB8727B
MHDDIRQSWLRPDRAIAITCTSAADGIDLAVTAQLAADLHDAGARVRVITNATTDADMWARLAQHTTDASAPYGHPSDYISHQGLATAFQAGWEIVTVATHPAPDDLTELLHKLMNADAAMAPRWHALVVSHRGSLNWHDLLTVGLCRSLTTVVVITDAPITDVKAAHALLELHTPWTPIDRSEFTPQVSWARVTADPYGGLINTTYRVSLDHATQHITLTPRPARAD